MVSQAIAPVGFGKAESDRVDLVIELVQGTAAPFRLCTRKGLAFGAARGLHRDWAKFADDWRGGYSPSMNRVHRVELPWTNIDALHRMVLDELLMKYSSPEHTSGASHDGRSAQR